MNVEILAEAPEPATVDLLCIGIAKEEELPEALAGVPGADDLSTKFRDRTMLRPPSGGRVLAIGLGDRDELDAERLRLVASASIAQAKRVKATSIGWDLSGIESHARPLIEGSILATYSFDRLKSKTGNEETEDSDAPGPDSLHLHGGLDLAELEVARQSALAANRTRDLQNLPANIANPAYLVERAREIVAAHDGLELEVLGLRELEEIGMGGLISVGAGSELDPAMIVFTHDGPGERLALVGKAVTFDTGGISLKRSTGMGKMKYDMSGGGAVIEAVNAICEMGTEINLMAAIPTVENMPSGTATRPGDVITQMNGKTVEVDNTDAEGRLILADALTYCARNGAARMIDIATLTGAVTSALGSTHAAVVGTDPELIQRLIEAGTHTGELLWELPLHHEHRKLMDGTVADLTNSSPKPKAGTITAAEFLKEFVEDVPWAHLDIAGSAWDLGRDYASKGPSGFGTRLLVAAAVNHAQAEPRSD